MPPANVSYMEPEERAIIRSWYRAAGEEAALGMAMLDSLVSGAASQ